MSAGPTATGTSVPFSSAVSLGCCVMDDVAKSLESYFREMPDCLTLTIVVLRQEDKLVNRPTSMQNLTMKAYSTRRRTLCGR